MAKYITDSSANGIEMREKSFCAKPTRLSKAGKWLKANPRGLGVTIYDMKALMK